MYEKGREPDGVCLPRLLRVFTLSGSAHKWVADKGLGTGAVSLWRAVEGLNCNRHNFHRVPWNLKQLNYYRMQNEAAN